jgi:hypothetical protein
LPAENNRLVKITDHSVNRTYIEFRVKNAWYFDTSNPADGYIDLIKVEFDFDFSQYGEFVEFESDIKKLFVKEFNKEFELPASRKFNKITVDDIKDISHNSLKISVSQDTAKVSVKTSTGDEDKFLMNYRHPLQNNDTLGIHAYGNFEIKDSIAPIIIRGYYSPAALERNGAEIVDTLYIWFSEPLSYCDISKETIGAKSSPNREYYFNIEPATISGDSVKISVKFDDAGIIPQNGDSIRIEGDFSISDNNGVTQKLRTIYAPLRVGEYMSDYEILIYPSIYVPNDGQTNPVIEKFGNPAEATNLAVIVKTVGKRVTTAKLSGNITVLDGLGNVITEKTEFVQANKEGVIIWTWDGKNKRARIVAPGVYQALIQVNNETNNKTDLFLRKIGIKK